MLIEQTAINFAANVISAVFGLINVVVFTRLFAPAEFGTYVLGVGFATTMSIFANSWLRLPIMREQARCDGTDVRGIILPGLMLSFMLAPAGYVAARLAGLPADTSLAAVGLAVVIGLFETSQDLLRARLQAFTLLKATALRAVLLPVLGIAFATAAPTGVLLLVASAIAYFLTVVVFMRQAWHGAHVRFDGARLMRLAWAGLPLTISLTLLTLSGVIDRFVIAYLVGPAAAGQYTAGADLVRQALIIPAVSASAAFVPLAVQILANRGRSAVHAHLDESLEFLLAIVLPACIGFAIAAPHIANVVLGPEFRAVAREVMPVVALAVIFQILTYQYLHISFLLSERNAVYVLNTGSVLAFNIVVTYFLIEHYGMIGAAWGRLAAEVFGFLGALALTRWTFPLPLPGPRVARVLIAVAAMALVVDRLERLVHLADRDMLALLIAAGFASYLAMCWLLDVAAARRRVNRALLMARQAT
jgi:O-antigen/teichoic acid export membrane protein